MLYAQVHGYHLGLPNLMRCRNLCSDCPSAQFAEHEFASCRSCLYLSSRLSSPSWWTQMEREMPLLAVSCPSCWLARTTTSAVVLATLQPMSSSRDQAARSQRSPQGLSGTEHPLGITCSTTVISQALLFLLFAG